VVLTKYIFNMLVNEKIGDCTIMKQELILPFESNPINQMYHYMAFPCGVIQANAQTDITPWLCGRYINIQYIFTDPDKTFRFDTQDDWGLDDGIAFRQTLHLDKDMYLACEVEWITLLKKVLGCGCYVKGTYNEEYIPGKAAYHKKYHLHDFFLIGYNETKEVFYSVGYLDNGFFQQYEIPYSNLIESLKTLKLPYTLFFFWKYNENADFSFNIFKVAYELRHYINSTTSSLYYHGDRAFGMKAQTELKKNLTVVSHERENLDVRFTRGLMEHKYYMSIRMKYLQDNCLIQDESIPQIADSIYKSAERIHMLGIKYNITHRQSILDSIGEIMDEIISLEKDYLSDVVAQLLEYTREVRSYEWYNN